jgi:hypothetical protein
MLPVCCHVLFINYLSLSLPIYFIRYANHLLIYSKIYSDSCLDLTNSRIKVRPATMSSTQSWQRQPPSLASPLLLHWLCFHPTPCMLSILSVNSVRPPISQRAIIPSTPAYFKSFHSTFVCLILSLVMLIQIWFIAQLMPMARPLPLKISQPTYDKTPPHILNASATCRVVFFVFGLVNLRVSMHLHVARARAFVASGVSTHLASSENWLD